MIQVLMILASQSWQPSWHLTPEHRVKSTPLTYLLILPKSQRAGLNYPNTSREGYCSV